MTETSTTSMSTTSISTTTSTSETTATTTSISTSTTTSITTSTVTSATTSTTTTTGKSIAKNIYFQVNIVIFLDTPCLPTCNPQQTCVHGVCVGIGYLSNTVTWSRPGDGDIVLATPYGSIIYWDNAGPSYWTDYGELDVDDKTGIGPENIFWPYSGSLPPTGYLLCMFFTIFF